MGSGTTQGMPAIASPLAASGAFPSPIERRRVVVPAPDFRRQPVLEEGPRLRMPSAERTPDQNPLHRLGQIEPRATQEAYRAA